jgi:type IV pilus assembly protein PilX
MKKQRGISLIVVLIGLVIISFAAVALLRSTDTATLIAGNLGFKKAALASGDAGSEGAIAWLNGAAAGTTLHADQADQGYYASSRDACDLTGTRTPNNTDDDVDWAGGDPRDECNVSAIQPNPQPAGVATDYSVSYIINRMCNAAGNPGSVLAADGITAMVCSSADASDDGSGSTKVGPDYSGYAFTGSSQTYYRITTRITGPRNTVRYTQTWVVI